MTAWLEEDHDAEGPDPWALGDDDVEAPERWNDEDDDVADDWLDAQLGRLRQEASAANPDSGASDSVARETPIPALVPPDPGSHLDGTGLGESALGESALGESGLGESGLGESGRRGVVLRHPAPSRPFRRRRADPEAAADLPPLSTPGYVRDRRGTWRYATTGRAVPGARDLTLRSLHRFPTQHGQVLVPVELVRTEAELGWCLAWKHTLTTRLGDGHVTTVLRVPAPEWERRADIPVGLCAPELAAGRLLGITDVARLVGVSPTTVTAYLSRRRMPAPVIRIANTPLWSRPIIRQWLATRPGQGRRS